MKKCKPIQPENQSSATIVAVADSPLTNTEATVLADCERVIERGQRVFLDTANALATIRDGRLYRLRTTHSRHIASTDGRSGNYANKQIAAAKVVKTLGTTVPILPTAETQVRPLLEFDEANQPKVWEKVVRQITSDGDSQAITARQITDAIEHEISKSEDEPFQKVKAQREAKAQANRAQYVQSKTEKSKATRQRHQQEERPRQATRDRGRPARRQEQRRGLHPRNAGRWCNASRSRDRCPRHRRQNELPHGSRRQMDSRTNQRRMGQRDAIPFRACRATQAT